MNILYLSSTHTGMHSHSIYYDLLQQFVANGDTVFVVYAREKRLMKKTAFYENGGIHYLGVKTGNISKNTNYIDKGIATCAIGSPNEIRNKTIFNLCQF